MKKNRIPSVIHDKDLLALIETQGSFIKNIENEIHENINQTLCLARIKLATLNMEDKWRSTEILTQSSCLIGKAIDDLRNLAKQVSGIGLKLKQ